MSQAVQINDDLLCPEAVDAPYAETAHRLVLASANRDPEQFSESDRFDITRGVTPQQHTAFAVGAHYCLGTPLARLEGVVAFTTLFQRFNTFALAVDKPVYKPMVIAWALERLPVVMA